MAYSLLKDRAYKVGEFADQHFIDKDGAVYTLIDKDTLAPPKDELFHDAGPCENAWDFYIEGYTRGEFAAYENCGMCTGAYMQSLLYRYRVEGGAEIMVKARKCFSGLKRIFEIGKQLEEGFFPKIYGNRFSHETSTDQVLYTVMALDHFYEFASAAEQAEIDHIITKMIKFWVKINYKYTYFFYENMQWPLMRFPPLLLLAYKHSGDKLFKDEYDRLLKEGFTKEPEFAILHRKKAGKEEASEYEKSKKAWVIAYLPDCMTMDIMNFDYLLSHDIDNAFRADWKQGIMTMWDEAKLTIAPDGKSYTHVMIDMKNGKVSRTVDYEKDNYELHGVKSGFSTMIARGAITAAKYFPNNNELKESAYKILLSFDVKDFTYWDEPERIFPKHRFKTRFLAGDSITNWLWAYWQGRYQKMFNQDL